MRGKGVLYEVYILMKKDRIINWSYRFNWVSCGYVNDIFGRDVIAQCGLQKIGLFWHFFLSWLLHGPAASVPLTEPANVVAHYR